MTSETDDTSAAPRRHRLARNCLVGALLVLALWIDRHLLAAIVWAAILAIATGPWLDRVAGSHPQTSRTVWVLLFTLVLSLLVLAPLVGAVAEAARERADVLQLIATARAQGVPVPAWVQQLPFGAASPVAHWWQANLATPAAASQQLGEIHATVVHHTRVWGSEIIHRSVIFGLTIVSYFFLLKEEGTILSQLRVAGDRLLGETGERVAQQVVLSIRGTINGLVVVGLGEGALMALVYWLAGAPHAVLLGGVTAIAAMIPFGAVLVFILVALLLIVQGSVLWACAVVVIGLLVVGIADHFIRPVLIGGATKLPFLLVLFGILGGIETLGLLGLFVGPAVMAALILLWREYVHAPVAAGQP